MSNIYIQEPPTSGKVLIKTTVGDIEIELWSKECPKACRNFVQLCMENYYNKTIFHRVVKDFIVQGGDPTGTGHGGESIYEKPFKDEIHSRLRFARRGLVAMANAGKDDNGSQFFFTMGPTQELQGKHTIFGRVAGDTIYNMLKLQDGVVRDDSPLNPNKILKTKVLINPFEDIVPRKLIELIKEEKKDKKPKSKMKATKDFGLLSFGDEAEEEEENLTEANKQFVTKGKSSHDLLSDPKLSSEVPAELLSGSKSQEAEESSEDEDMPAPVVREVVDIEGVRDKLKKSGKSKDRKRAATPSPDEDEDDDHHLKEKIKMKKQLRQEIKALQKELKGDKNKDKVDLSDKPEDKDDFTEEEKRNDMLMAFHEEKKKYKDIKKPKKGSAREDMTMKLLEKFKNKLNSARDDEVKVDEETNDEDDVSGTSWMSNKLQFESSDPVLAKDASSKDDEWFDIYDPRNPVNKRRRGEKSMSGGQNFSTFPNLFDMNNFQRTAPSTSFDNSLGFSQSQGSKDLVFHSIPAPVSKPPEFTMPPLPGVSNISNSNNHNNLPVGGRIEFNFNSLTPIAPASLANTTTNAFQQPNIVVPAPTAPAPEHKPSNRGRGRKRNPAEPLDAKKEEKLRKQREYYQRKREERIQKQAEYYKKNREKMKKRQSQYYYKNRTEKLKKQLDYYYSNQEEMKQKQRDYYQAKRLRELNKPKKQ